ncbi:MAG: PAS domain S-box protein, partial [Proteobacteria bacterium]|nr:PAS domain S-box protein [Pseudomonadota bacterium]
SKLKESGHYEKFVGRLICKDGSIKNIEVSSSAVYDNGGEFIGSLDIVRDITARLKTDEDIRRRFETMMSERSDELARTNKLLIEKIKQRQEAEDARRASENKIRRIFESLREDYFFYSRDLAGVFVYLSPSIQDVLGYSRKEFAEHATLYRTANPVNDLAADALKQIRNGRNRASFEQEFVAKDGIIHWLDFSEVPLRDESGKIIGAEGVAHDITDRKLLEKEILKTQKLESTGILAGGIAHDFNNLLSAILGNISLAKIYAEPESKVFEKLEQTEKASWRARDLTQQLLTFAKGGSPVTRPESIEEMVKDSAWFTLRGSNVKCAFHAPDDLMAVDVDEGQICQVIQNIAHNADQAMPDGGNFTVTASNVTIDSSSQLPLSDGPYVLISLKDDGPGISKKDLEKIFDPYFTTKRKGSGLGLAISYSIVRSHGGLITATSVKGQGTEFLIYLPATEHKPLAVVKDDGKSLSRKGSGRILIMDDDEIVREIGCEMLEHLGYRAVAVSDGKMAVDLYQEELAAGDPFDVVILDLTVPGGMGGQETIRQLKVINPDVKGIVSSGYANDEILANHREYGFLTIMPKPYKIEGLNEILKNILSE